MRRAIRAAVSDGHATVAVVCGAWHVPALDIAATLGDRRQRHVARPAARSRSASAGCRGRTGASPRPPGTAPGSAARAGTTTCSAIPGPTASPGSSSTPPTCCAAPAWPASPDHLIAASRMAETLSVLRGRPRPGLDEVLDSADTVMGGLPLVRRRLVVGEAIGEVPPGAPQVPLARDLLVRQRRVRLKPRSDVAVVELDLRTPNGLRRSHLLHQLVALGVAMGCARGGARHERDVPRDLAGRVGAGAVGAPRRARRARHHRRAGGDQPARRAGDERRRAARARRRPRSGAARAICRSRSGRSSSSSRRGPPTIPTSAS